MSDGLPLALNAQSTFLHNYLRIFGAALLVYDYSLTLPAEVKYIWNRNLTLSNALFLVGRYFALLSMCLCTAILMTTGDEQRCSQVSSLDEWSTVVFRIFAGVLLVLRTWALYGRSKRLLFFMVALAVGLTVVIFWALIMHPLSLASTPGCSLNLDTPNVFFHALVWELGFFFESVLFVLTLLKTIETWKYSQTLSRYVGRPSLMYIIFRDGTVHFAVMTLGTLPNIITFYLPNPSLRGSLSTFGASISVIGMSRLVLSLHKITRGDPMSSQTMTTFMARKDTMFGTEMTKMTVEEKV